MSDCDYCFITIVFGFRQTQPHAFRISSSDIPHGGSHHQIYLIEDLIIR